LTNSPANKVGFTREDCVVVVHVVVVVVVKVAATARLQNAGLIIAEDVAAAVAPATDEHHPRPGLPAPFIKSKNTKKN
jgi:hypothetical protein